MSLVGCYYDEDSGLYLDSYGRVCMDDSSGGYYGSGGGVPPNILVTPGGTQIPGSNLSNILNNIGSWLALLTHQTAVPTALSQPNQAHYPVAGQQVGVIGQPLGGGSLGGTVGSSLQKFISSPTGLLVIGAAVLLYMKPPGRR